MSTQMGTQKRVRKPRYRRRVCLSLLLAGVALLTVLGALSLAAPADLPDAVVYHPIVDAVISQVSTQTLSYELAGLTGERPVTVAGSPYTITTRYSLSGQPISMATRYAYEQLAGLGLPTTFHTYTYTYNSTEYELRNVVAEKPGVANPDELYLITAHIDDLPRTGPAPGADDNGSGSVAVLMAARLLNPHYFAHTIRFVLFTGEEQGLRGSAAYAADCAAQGDDIRGVVNLDMIAYDSDAAPIIDMHTDDDVPDSLELARTFSETVQVYGLDLTPDHLIDGPGIYRSDQWSFLTRDYPAFLVIEDWQDFTPHYHQSSDTLATLNLDYYAEATRAAIATLMHLARPVGGVGTISGTVTAQGSGQPLAATVSTVLPGYAYTRTTTTDANGAYALTLPDGTYTVTATPLPGHYAETVTSVLVITDTVTPQNFSLVPWSRPEMGVISGAVTAQGSGQPLAATMSTFLPSYAYTMTSTTGAGGMYSFTLPAGGYTVTAELRHSYYPLSATGVLVVTDTLTIQDFALAAWPRWYLPVILRP